MSLRKKINENPVIPVLGVVLAVAVCVYFVWDIITTPNPGGFGKDWVAFYSIDDGKTVFSDKRPPSEPFQKDGKDAVLAIVYTCDNNKTNFVHCLIKRTEESFTPRGFTAPVKRKMNYIKKPGDTEWVSEENFGKWSAIERDPKCPDGSAAVPVTPAGMNLEAVAKRPGKGAAKGADTK